MQGVETEETLATDPQPQPLTFVDAVRAALAAKQVKPKCSSCSAIGWANFEIHGEPLAVHVLGAPRAIPIAALICLKCADVNSKSLQHLGITMTMQEQRIVTPDQAQRPSLIVPG